MSKKSKIEWTDETWNPVTGCAKVSQGCKHCYAERTWERLSANPKTVYFGREFTDVRCHVERLDQPLRWTKPRRIFVNSMSDLFHEDVPFEFIAAVFGVMSRARRHTFQVLTKRPKRMLEFCCWLLLQTQHKAAWVAQVNHAEFICSEPQGHRGSEKSAVEALAISAHHDRFAIFNQGRSHGSYYRDWPLPNVWLGVSVEDQATADERIPLLLNTPAAVRWISAEPLLGPVNINPHLELFTGTGDASSLDWVVVGGESGPKARPMHPDWVRGLRNQCEAAGVPFLFKQWGEWQIASVENGHRGNVMPDTGERYTWIDIDGNTYNPSPPWELDCCCWAMAKVGKKHAGRLLDGELHDGYPQLGGDA